MSKKLGSAFCLDSFAQVTQPQVYLHILSLFFFSDDVLMQNCKTTHVTCSCLKILIIVVFFLLNSRNAVCILAVLVAGILTATCTLLFVVK